MPLFNRHPYPGGYGMGMPMRRRAGFRGVLFVVAVVLGLYFLNMAFLWVKVPVLTAANLKVFNIIIGIFLIIMGLTAMIRPRMY
jgi:hypothetical protein